MEKIIDPVDISLIRSELLPERKICDTNKGDNEIYVINAHNAPNVMREIGRLREESYRAAGGSSGLSLDIDEFDTMEKPYEQIVVWDPREQKIIGGYRYILGTDIVKMDNGQPNLASSHIFKFSGQFINDYLPHTIELGRAFVSLEYQNMSAGPKAIYALDNLWDGISAVILMHPNMMYFFGKVTMYPSYDKTARDLILHFLWKHFGDKDALITALEPVEPVTDNRLIDMILDETEFKQDFRKLKNAVHRLGTSIPPMFNSYLGLSSELKMLGTAHNREFGDTDETGILVCFDEIYSDKRDRHVIPFLEATVARLKKRFPNLEPGIREKLATRWSERRERGYSRFRISLRRRNK